MPLRRAMATRPYGSIAGMHASTLLMQNQNRNRSSSPNCCEVVVAAVASVDESRTHQAELARA